MQADHKTVDGTSYCIAIQSKNGGWGYVAKELNTIGFQVMEYPTAPYVLHFDSVLNAELWWEKNVVNWDNPLGFISYTELLKRITDITIVEVKTSVCKRSSIKRFLNP